MPITEGRARLYEIAENISKNGKKYVFTERGRPTLVIMSLAEYEGWQETQDLMRNFPKLAKELYERSADYDKVDFVPLANALRQKGLNKIAQRYEKRLSNRNTSKRK